MKLYIVVAIIFIGQIGLIPSTFGCFPLYVPDFDEQDLEDFGKARPRTENLDCECGKPISTQIPKDEFSWIVKITVEFPTIGSRSCWGSIINDLFVITSAKCLVDYEHLNIRDDLLTPTKFNVNKIQLHTIGSVTIDFAPKAVHCHSRAIPTYITQKDIDYDVCIIELNKRLNFNKQLSPICTPDLKDLSKNYVGQQGIILGWDGEKNSVLDTDLHLHIKKELSWIYNPKTCGRDKDRLFCTQFAHSSHDSFHFQTTGSPLMILLRSGQMLQTGISSFHDVRQTEKDSLYSTSPLEISTNLGNKEIMSFINKKSEIANARWCKSSGPFEMNAVSKDFDHQPATYSAKTPWEGFTSDERKITDHCKCGIRKSRSIGRIVGGQEAAAHEYPWQIQIFSAKTPNSNLRELCGGTLINSKIVLTAAHCVATVGGGPASPAEKINVRLRRHEGFGVKADESDIVSVKNVFVHPEFLQTKNFDSDIALLELKDNLVFSPESKLSPVCIPNWNEFGPNNTQLFGQLGMVIGWGWTSPDKTSIAPTLQELVVPIRNQEECNAGMNQRVIMPPNTICATNLKLRNDYQDPSHGDSGGPLMVSVNTNPKTDVQVGIVSVGTWETARNDERPGVWFTSVGDFLPFIDYFSFKVGGVWCSRLH